MKAGDHVGCVVSVVPSAATVALATATDPVFLSASVTVVVPELAMYVADSVMIIAERLLDDEPTNPKA